MKLGIKVVVIVVVVFFSAIQTGGATTNFVPLNIGLDFVQPFGGSDILRGFKKNIRTGESNFKAKPFTGNIKTRAFPTEFVKSSTLESEDEVEDSLDLSGTMKANFGPISGKGSASFMESKIRTKYRAEVIYTRRSAAFTRFVDLETLQESPELLNMCGGPPCDGKTIAREFGTKFVDQVVYGAQLDFIFTVTSEYKLDMDKLKAKITAQIFGEKVTKKIEKGSSKSSSEYKMTIKARAVGVHFPVPSNPTFEEANELIDSFSKLYEEVTFSLATLSSESDENNVLKKLAPIGFTLQSISDYLGALDANEADIMDIKMDQLGTTLFDSVYKKQKLLAVMDEEHLSRAHDNPRFRERRFVEYKKEAKKMLTLLDKLVEECMDYRQQTLDKIIAGDPPLGIGQLEDTTLEKTYYALTGMGYIAPPLKIHNLAGSVSTYDQLYYTGFALPVRNSKEFELMPYFSGAVFDDNTEEIVTRGNTTNDIYEKLSAIISPTGLPSDNIGYLTPFTMALPSYKNSTGHLIPGVYYTTAYDAKSKDFVPRTHFDILFFCDDSADTAQLQIAQKPEDLYDDQGIKKGQSECVRYGDIVFLAISFLSSGDIFLKVKDAPSGSWGHVEFGNPSIEGAKVKDFQWKIQSVIPFNGDPSLEDPLNGECVHVNDYEEYNVIFQNMGYNKRWLTGGRGGPENGRNFTHANNIFDEGNPKNPPAYIGVYRWQLSNYEKARTDMLCD